MEPIRQTMNQKMSVMGFPCDDLVVEYKQKNDLQTGASAGAINAFKSMDLFKLITESTTSAVFFKIGATLISNLSTPLSYVSDSVAKLSQVKFLQYTNDETKNLIDVSRQNTKIFGGDSVNQYENTIEKFNPEKSNKRTLLHFINKLDSLGIGKSIAEDLKDSSKVAVVNFANSVHVGGAFQFGKAGSQEEDILRRSYLFSVINPQFNGNLVKQLVELKSPERHIPYLSVIYSPSVPLLNHEMTEHCKTLSFISVAAVDRRESYGEMAFLQKVCKDNECPNVEQLIAEIMKAKIRMILVAAASGGHTHLVLGQLGCGAFLNEPKVVAQLIREVLAEDKFNGLFENIYFPVFSLDETKMPENKKFIESFV